MAEFSKRVGAAFTAAKARIRQPGNADAGVTPPSDADELRRAAADLEADLTKVLERSSRAKTLAADCETRAMDAIRSGDDNAARLALREHQGHTATIQQLDADAGVLRAMLAECAVVLGESEQASRPSASGELIVGVDDAPPVPLQEGNPESADSLAMKWTS